MATDRMLARTVSRQGKPTTQGRKNARANAGAVQGKHDTVDLWSGVHEVNEFAQAGSGVQ
jgi:hypothetical protein